MEIQEFIGRYTSSNGQGYAFWSYGLNVEDARTNAQRLHGGSGVFNWDEAISRAKIKPLRRKVKLSPLDEIAVVTA